MQGHVYCQRCKLVKFCFLIFCNIAETNDINFKKLNSEFQFEIEKNLIKIFLNENMEFKNIFNICLLSKEPGNNMRQAKSLFQSSLKKEIHFFNS